MAEFDRGKLTAATFPRQDPLQLLPGSKYTPSAGFISHPLKSSH